MAETFIFQYDEIGGSPTVKHADIDKCPHPVKRYYHPIFPSIWRELLGLATPYYKCECPID